MARVTREDAMMKIPALEHLSRLGYVYLPRKSVPRDRETNIIPQSLKTAMERINDLILSQDQMETLMRELRSRLNADDLGQAFYELLRHGWEGKRLIDYDRPEMNLFQEMTEAECRRGKSFFRPDITLYVNGLPLAMIEVKTQAQNHGVRAEYDRMLERFRNPELRPFVQETQIWAISNGRDNDPDRLLPTEGSCYAATSRGDFALHPFSERHPCVGRRLPKADPETIRMIRMDNGLQGKTDDKEDVAIAGDVRPGQCQKDQRKAQQRKTVSKKQGIAISDAVPSDTMEIRSSRDNAMEMLTGLFLPQRFLFLLRYGIRYERTLDEFENAVLRKRVLTAEQLFTLIDLQGKMRRGFRNCVFLPVGREGEPAMLASLIAMAGEEYPGSRVYQVLRSRKELLRAEAELQGCGIICGRRTRTEGADIILMEPALNPAEWLREAPERNFSGRRIVLLPEPDAEEENIRLFRRALRRADPEAILIRGYRVPGGSGRNYVYLLECADGTYYCGWTNDLQHRLAAHNEGRGAKYTLCRGPVRVVYTEEFDTREEALSREWHLKRMTRKQKEALIALAAERAAQGKTQKQEMD